MNIIIDKEVQSHLADIDIMNQIQYIVNQMMAVDEKECTTTSIQTMAGTFYIYNYEDSIYVMKN